MCISELQNKRYESYDNTSGYLSKRDQKVQIEMQNKYPEAVATCRRMQILNHLEHKLHPAIHKIIWGVGQQEKFLPLFPQRPEKA